MFDVNAFGPVQLYVAPAIVFTVRFKFCPAQTIELFDGVGAPGIGFTVAVVNPNDPVQPPTVTFTE